MSFNLTEIDSNSLPDRIKEEIRDMLGDVRTIATLRKTVAAQEETINAQKKHIKALLDQIDYLCENEVIYETVQE